VHGPVCALPDLKMYQGCFKDLYTTQLLARRACKGTCTLCQSRTFLGVHLVI
jgi:hypothetical protein